MLTKDTTLGEIIASEPLQIELTAILMSNGIRGAMWERKVSYDSADRIAEGVKHAVGIGLARSLPEASA